jgi:hypothetical protein
MRLCDWFALFPDLPVATPSLCLLGAGNTARSDRVGADQNTAVAGLMSDHLEELRVAGAL